MRAKKNVVPDYRPTLAPLSIKMVEDKLRKDIAELDEKLHPINEELAELAGSLNDWEFALKSAQRLYIERVARDRDLSEYAQESAEAMLEDVQARIEVIKTNHSRLKERADEIEKRQRGLTRSMNLLKILRFREDFSLETDTQEKHSINPLELSPLDPEFIKAAERFHTEWSHTIEAWKELRA